MGRFAWLAFAAGLVVRVALIPRAGFALDIATFEDWALAFARHGPHALYADTSNLRWAAVDYPPAYLLVLGAVGWIAIHVFHIARSGGLAFEALVKTPAILADVALAFVAFHIALRVSGRAQARIVFAALLLAPPLWIVSAYWGQVDSVAVLALLGALLAALSSRMTVAWLLLTLAILIKPQSAPVAFLLLMWELQTFGATWRLARSISFATILAYAVTIVFSPTLAPVGAFRWLLERYLVGVGKYPNSSSGAFNIYTIGGSFWQSDGRSFAGITLHDWGDVAYIALLAAILRRLWHQLAPAVARRDRERALLTASFIALVGLFMIVTRMHERYLLPGLVVGALVACWSRETAPAEAILATIFSINCAFILAGFYGGSHHPLTLAIARVASLANVITFVSIACYYFGRVRPPRLTSSRTVAS